MNSIYGKNNISGITPKDSICHICGNSPAILYVEEKNNKWAIWYPVYTKEYRRHLCGKCVKSFSPLTCHLLDKGNPGALRHLPFLDKGVKPLTTVTKKQLESRPEYFPAYELARRNFTVTIKDVTYCSDCKILTFTAKQGLDYWIDYYMKTHGCLYTSVSLYYRLEFESLPCVASFSSYYNKSDRERLVISWRT